jgi:hypothetical protein
MYPNLAAIANRKSNEIVPIMITELTMYLSARSGVMPDSRFRRLIQTFVKKGEIKT